MTAVDGRKVKASRWRCPECGKEIADPALLVAPHPFDLTDVVYGCPFCKQCMGGFVLLCDEAGCPEESYMGWPTGDGDDAWGGYRWTCNKHDKSKLEVGSDG